VHDAVGGESPAEESDMKLTNGHTPDVPAAQWLSGYSAAINDAVAIVDALGGPSFHNFSAPVLLRLKSRLIELGGDQAHEAA
jgi:hypothetical protein